MDELSFSLFPNENFLDLRLYQYGWEQCAPLHSYGPTVRNHYLFHYVISGQGWLDSNDQDGVTRKHCLGADQGFLICAPIRPVPGDMSGWSSTACGRRSM